MDPDGYPVEETVVHRRLREIDPTLPQSVADVIGKGSRHAILESMISSQMDADRIDYLLRDSECVGVQYGKFDAHRLINMLMRQGGQVVVDHRGLMNVEEYLFARYHMYWQVYFHPTTRGYECLLRAAWKRARALCDVGKLPFDGITPAVRSAMDGTLEAISLGQYLALDNHDVFIALKVWQTSSDAILADLSRRLLDRRLLKPIPIEDVRWGLEKEVEDLVRQQGFDPAYYVLEDRSSDVAYDYYTLEEGESPKSPSRRSRDA